MTPIPTDDELLDYFYQSDFLLQQHELHVVANICMSRWAEVRTALRRLVAREDLVMVAPLLNVYEAVRRTPLERFVRLVFDEPADAI